MNKKHLTIDEPKQQRPNLKGYAAVDDAIKELGWDGCGGELYKAGQAAEFLTIERELYDNLEDIIKDIAIDYLININAQITTEQMEAIFDALGNIDNNNILDDIADAINDIINEGEAAAFQQGRIAELKDIEEFLGVSFWDSANKIIVKGE